MNAVVFATWVNRQIVFNGLVSGLIFGLLAMGIVLIYRSSKVINFAVTNLGLFGAGLFALMNLQYRLPFWLCAATGLVAGVLLGALMELSIVRRLFAAPRVILLVATIGMAQVGLVLLIVLPKIKRPGVKFPVPIGASHKFAGIRITGPNLTILLMSPLIALALGWMLNRTALGKAVKASADNPDLARLAGISPKTVSTAVWAIAGGLATLSIMLLGGQAGAVANLAQLGPTTLVRALAAAVIASMASFRRAFVAGIVVGVFQSLVQFNWIKSPGLFDFIMLLVVLASVYRQSRSGTTEIRTYSYASKVRPIPERLRSIWWVRHIDKLGFLLMGVAAFLLPLIVTKPSRHLVYTIILTSTIIALSVTVLTGWAGQLSLGQLGFAGLGAMLAAGFVHGIHFDFGPDWLHLKGATPKMPFPLAVVCAVLVVSAMAALIGITALRVRGLYLAVTTFAFALATTQYFFRRPIFNGGKTVPVPFKRTKIFGLDMTTQRSFYYVVLVATAVVIFIVTRLRRTGIARNTIAMRDNPDSAAAYTISAIKVKLRAFAFAGGLAALGGAFMGANLQAIPNDRYFTVADSLTVVAMAVIGGLGSVGGAVLGAVWVVGLPSFFPGNQTVPLLTSSLGLLALLLYFPGGFVQIAHSLRAAIIRFAERRMPDAPVKQTATVPKAPTRVAVASVANGVPALRVVDGFVRFGGIAALDRASIDVPMGKVVGLIGTNGAGKSTLMNAVGGFVDADGQFELFGEEIGDLSPSQRASLGLGRTFQAANLFPELTVHETVLVALEGRRRTGSMVGALVNPAAIKRERARRSEASEIVDFLGLGRYNDAYISDLSTGTRRIVELAGLLALNARMLCLDEPTAGLAQRETEAFGPLILQIRRELDASMLVIEHDMPLIMSISDHVYCLEAGRVIASGDPVSIRNNPSVIASYLGTDERAIERSGVTG